MSRYDEGDGDETFPGAYELYAANLERALRGKRGRKALAELREALLALPEHRLIEGAMCTVNPDKRKAPELELDGRKSWYNIDLTEKVGEVGEGVCAVGAFLWHKKVKAGMDPTEAFDAIPTLLDVEYDLNETASEAQAAGLARTLAWELAYRNDEAYVGLTPEERWTKYLAWIDERLALPPLTRS